MPLSPRVPDIGALDLLPNWLAELRERLPAATIGLQVINSANVTQLVLDAVVDRALDRLGYRSRPDPMMEFSSMTAIKSAVGTVSPRARSINVSCIECSRFSLDITDVVAQA